MTAISFSFSGGLSVSRLADCAKVIPGQSNKDANTINFVAFN